MTWKNWVMGILLVAALVAAFLVLRSPAEPGPGECVPNWPRVVVDGKLRHDLWMVYYYLGHTGKRAESGTACIAWREVTESEYERRMYE